MALTTATALTQELFAMIAAQMLNKADDQLWFRDNVQPVVDGSPEPGASTVTFNIPDLPTGTYTEASRRMTEGTAVSTSSKAITMSTKTLTIREYGGPYDSGEIRPFGYTDKIAKMAKHQIVQLIGGFLGRDRQRFIDNVRRADLLSTTNVVTPDGTSEGTIGSGAQMTAAHLRQLNKQMKDALVPTFPNGRWKLVITTKDEQDLKNDPEIQKVFQHFGAASAAANVVAMDGKIGAYEGFDIYTDTLMPASAVGAGGGVVGYQGLAFGPWHLGHQVIQDAEPRVADDTDFGRQQRIMWNSLEAFGLLYGDYVFRTVTT